MVAKYGRANRIWVMDRGMMGEENLKFLRERGGQYIVGTPKAKLRQFCPPAGHWQDSKSRPCPLLVRPPEAM